MRVETLQQVFSSDGSDVNCSLNLKTDASNVAYTPSGALSGTNMQDALDELEVIAGGGVAWGAITGTLSSQSDLNSALAAKQAALVSGTNIKTINGVSLLGSGDMTVAGSGTGNSYFPSGW